MIDPQVETEIRRLFFAEHWKVGTIAGELSVHHSTIKRVINADGMVRTKGAAAGAMLDPFKDFIALTLEQHPKLRATRLFEMLRARGYAGGVHVVRRHVRAVRPRPKREVF